MGIVDELERLEGLRRAGTLTDEEFARAKDAVLSAAATSPAEDARSIHAAHLEDLRRQNELERLDREWDRERERYTIRGRYGSRYTPSRGVAIGMGVLSVAFGVFWLLLATDVTRNGFRMTGGGAFLIFPLFGVLFIVVSLFVAVDTYRKAAAYEAAEADYRRRRAALLMAQEARK